MRRHIFCEKSHGKASSLAKSFLTVLTYFWNRRECFIVSGEMDAPVISYTQMCSTGSSSNRGSHNKKLLIITLLRLFLLVWPQPDYATTSAALSWVHQVIAPSDVCLYWAGRAHLEFGPLATITKCLISGLSLALKRVPFGTVLTSPGFTLTFYALPETVISPAGVRSSFLV